MSSRDPIKHKHSNLHAVGKSFMWRCHYCRVVVHCRTCEPDKSPERAATRDHYIPRSRGGRNRGANIVLACQKCNQEKAATMPEDTRGQRFSEGRWHLPARSGVSR